MDPAIQNVGEYYAAHYLAEQFARDIADQAKAWKAQGSQSVPRRLQALSDAYFRAKTRALDHAAPEARGSDPELAAWHAQLLHALGYLPEPLNLALDSEGRTLPALLRLHRHGRPWLAVLQAPFCLSDGEQAEEPLEIAVGAVEPPDQAGAEPDGDADTEAGWPSLDTDWETAVATLFRQEDRPRWALLLAGSRVYLFDAHTYAQGRYLYIGLDDAYARKQPKTFEVVAALLARETLAPGGESDEVLHERLRAGSQRSTHGVSEKLQAAVREAITAIANGWVEARRSRKLGFRVLGPDEPRCPAAPATSPPSSCVTRPWSTSTASCSASTPRPAGASSASSPSATRSTDWATAWRPCATSPTAPSPAPPPRTAPTTPSTWSACSG
jgi:hypothetical protein